MPRSSKSVFFSLLAVSLLAACGDADAPAESAALEDSTAASEMAVGTTKEYDWYMQGSTPAGRTTIVKNGDGKITNESFVHWNNREWTVKSEIQLDDNGRVIS
ncbi:MAG: hypothetical protein AAFN50_15320, partial [Pseudomonadota bacterium]